MDVVKARVNQFCRSVNVKFVSKKPVAAVSAVPVADAIWVLTATTAGSAAAVKNDALSTASAATVARMMVVAAQAQGKTLAAVVGTPASDGKAISPSDVAVAIQNKILQILPAIAAVSTHAGVVAATTTASPNFDPLIRP